MTKDSCIFFSVLSSSCVTQCRVAALSRHQLIAAPLYASSQDVQCSLNFHRNHHYEYHGDGNFHLPSYVGSLSSTSLGDCHHRYYCFAAVFFCSLESRAVNRRVAEECRAKCKFLLRHCWLKMPLHLSLSNGITFALVSHPSSGKTSSVRNIIVALRKQQLRRSVGKWKIEAFW